MDIPPARWDKLNDPVYDRHLPLELYDGENWIARFPSVAVAAIVMGYDVDDILTRLEGEIERPVRQMPMHWRWRWRPRKLAAAEAGILHDTSEEFYEISTDQTVARFRIRADMNRMTDSFSHISERIAVACVYMWSTRSAGTRATGAAKGIHPNPPSSTLNPNRKPNLSAHDQSLILHPNLTF